MKRFLYIMIPVFLLLPMDVGAKAGKYIFEHVRTSNHWINSIYQDANGFIWFGTRNGLYRYTGDDASGTDAVCEGESFYDIQQDADGRLWVKKRNGYVVYDPRTCTVLDEVKSATELDSRLWIDALLVTLDGDYWWNEEQHLYHKSLGSEKTLVADVQGDVYDIIVRNSIVYVLTVEGLLYRFALDDSGEITTLPMMGPALTRPEDNMDYRFHCVFVDSSQNIWLSQGAGGVWYYPAGSMQGRHLTSSSSPERIQGGFICAIEEDADGNIWLASDHGGICVCGKDGRVIERLRNEPDDNNTLASNGVYALFRDREDNIWVGYTKKGMSIYRGRNKTWSVSHLMTLHEDGLPDDVNASCEDHEGNLWLGTDGSGLLRIDPDGNETLYNTSNSALKSNVITDIHCDSEGRIWLGTFYGGLSCIENGRMMTYSYSEDDNSLASMNVWSVAHDEAGRIWIGTLGAGLQALDPETGIFETFTSARHGLANDFIHEIECALDGNIYIATSYGLSIFNPHTCSFKTIEGSPERIHMALTGLEVDSNGLVWLDEDGLLRVYDPVSSMYHTPSHPALKSVRSIIEDEDGTVWAITDAGLCRLSVEKSQADDYSFDISAFSFPQQRELHFNQRSACMTSSGDFVIGSFSGYMRFSPYKYSEPQGTGRSQLFFTDLYLGNSRIVPGVEYEGKIILDRAMEYTSAIELDHSSPVVLVEFSCLDYFSVQEQNLYSKVEGVTEEWIEVDKNSRRLTMGNLSPGRYRLILSPDMEDLSDAVSLSVRIMPPWWATWWAVIIYILLGLSGIITSYVFVRRKDEEKRRRQEAVARQEQRHYMDEMKMQFFTNISHDFRTPLTLILTPVEEMLSKKPELKDDTFISTIHRNALMLLNLVNEVLDLRKMERFGSELTLVKADIIRVIEDTVSSFMLMAENQNITLKVDTTLSSMILEIDKGKIAKVLTNLLSNAFKFTPEGGTITVKVEETSESACISVCDTGQGVSDKDKRKIFERFYQAKNSPAGSGIGLHIVREFVLLHGGDITVEDNDPCGAVFRFTLPMKSSFAEEVTDGEKSSPASADVSKPVILIADDNIDFRTFMKVSLSQDYNVYEASDGLDALKMLSDKDIDVVISDVMMPNMDGTEFCRKVKSDINTSHIPVILLTAKALQDDECYGLESGADDYLTKPFNMSILRLRIAKFIEWKKRSKKLFEKELEITTEQITLTSMDDRLLQQAINLINENISNPDFSVSELSAALCMHRANLYKKLLYITGKTPVEFIRAIRLKRAAALLETDGVYVSEVAYMVGFNSPKVFAGHFREEFGCSPSEYRKKHNNN